MKKSMLVIAVTFLISCSGKDDPAKVPDIYLSGSRFSGVYIPIYIKNTQEFWFTEDPTDAYNTGMVVVGDDVYGCGYEDDLYYERNIARVWKNQSSMSLEINGRESQIRDMTVSASGEVFAGGYQNNTSDIAVATVWINGTASSLTDGKHDAKVYGVAVSGGSYYAVGGQTTSGSSPWPTLWKDGVASTLPITGASGFANKIAISANGDVCIVGYDFDLEANISRAVYWKNGVEFYLGSAGNLFSYGNAIAVDGDDVYVAGQEQVTNSSYTTKAKYWKNGTAVNLTDGTNSAIAECITLYKNDIYVGGAEQVDGYFYMKYWKNGTEFQISDYHGSVETIILR